MANDKKPKPPRIISPTFTAMFAWLNTPNMTHDKTFGAYQVSGLFDPKNPEHRAFLGKLKELHTASITDAQSKFKPTKVPGTKKGEKPTMTTLEITAFYHEQDDSTLLRVNFKEKGHIVYKDKVTGEDKRADLKPLIVDARGQETDVEVWSGSDIKVAIDVVPFFSGNKTAGLSLRLKGVQVITLRTRGSRDGASLGFGAVEGGFTGGADSPFNGSSTPADSDGGADDDFLNDDEGSPDDTDGGVPEASTDGKPAPAADDYDF